MTHATPRTIPMRLKTMAGLFAISATLLTGSPALATQLARQEPHCHACRQEGAPSDYRTFAMPTPHMIDAPRWKGGQPMHDDWPSNMLLG